MCITSAEALLSGTRIYAGEARRRGQLVHVLAYQNSAKSLVRGPNAMILPLPAAVMPGRDNVLDTRGYKDFLKSICNATMDPNAPRAASARGIAGKGMADVFNVGSYTVVLASSAAQVPEALTRVPPEKRPAINEEVLSSFTANYPGWPLAVCCWDGSIEAEPLLWWYEPISTEVLFAPGLDAHDGKAPRKQQVKVDAIVCFGSTLRPVGETPVTYRDVPEDVAQFLPPSAVGEKITGAMPNGDYWYPTQNLTAGGNAKVAYRQWPTQGSPNTPFALGTW